MIGCQLVDPRGWDRHGQVLGRCGWCGGELPLTKAGKINPNRRWCRRECSDAYWDNHSWTSARPAAIRRDGHECVRCHAKGYGASGREQGAPYVELEVNHKIPRNGAGYSNGCWHHLEDLETLCHDCHVRETTRQIRERRGLPLEGRPAPRIPVAPGQEQLGL